MARRCALLVGCDSYDHKAYQRLSAPVPDIQALAALLRDEDVGGYDDVVLIGRPDNPATHTAVREAIDEFFQRRQPDDMLLLYIASHGHRAANGELLFIMKDTHPDRLKATAISSTWVSRCLDDSRSSRVVVLLDCCYSGAYRSRGRDGVLPILQVGDSGRIVITASQAAERAWEEIEVGSGPARSFFMKAVVSGIDSGAADLDGDGRISVFDLYNYVYAQMEPVRSLQTPVLQGELRGALNVAYRRGGRPVEVTLAKGTWKPLPAQRSPEPNQVRTVAVLLPRPRSALRAFVVQRWLSRPGDRVEQGGRLLEVERNGNLRYIEAPATGILRAISAAEGESVEPGGVLGAIAIGGSGPRGDRPVGFVAGNAVLRTEPITLSIEGQDLAQVMTWWLGVGDRVNTGQPLVTILVGGSTRDVPSPVDGVIRAIIVEPGEAVESGNVVAIIAVG